MHKILEFIERRPLVSFFSLLSLLLIVIVIGNFVRQPKAVSENKAELSKEVDVYSIGENPRVQVSARVEKSGIVTILAQTPGIVQGLNKIEGTYVNKGEWLLTLSTNYQGGNIPSLSREIAQKNLNFVEDTYETQKQMISKRRDIANSTDTMSDELRDITNKSIDETKSLISLNEETLNFYDSQIKDLETSGASDSVIIPVKQTKSGILSGLNALRQALRNSEFQASGAQEPAHLSDISRDLTQQQLDIEEKSLKFNREVSKLNLRIAQINESLMYPSSPVEGVVERIYVKVGDQVNPGTKLMTITGSTLNTQIIAFVSSETANNISRFDKSKIKIGSEIVDLFPEYISTEPTDGQLHNILYSLPEKYNNTLSNGAYVSIEIPISKSMSLSSIPFVPLDAIYQTQNDSYLFVATRQKNGKYLSESRSIDLGTVVGSYVEIKKGLKEADLVILDRDVVTGDIVTIK